MKKKTLSGALAMTLTLAAPAFAVNAPATVSPVMSASSSAAQASVAKAFDGDKSTAWTLDANALKQPQWLMLTIANPGDVQSVTLTQKGATPDQLKRALDIFVTYDPMNLGDPVAFTANADKAT